MNNEEIKNYISTERARGVQDLDIKNELLAKGWKEEVIAPLFVSEVFVSESRGKVFGSRLGKKTFLKLVLLSIPVVAALIFIAVVSFVAMWGHSALYLIPIGVSLISLLFVLIVSVYAIVRRLHDVGHSGWWALLSTVSPINFIMIIYLCFKDGEAGANAYGQVPDPSTPFFKALLGK